MSPSNSSYSGPSRTPLGGVYVPWEFVLAGFFVFCFFFWLGKRVAPNFRFWRDTKRFRRPIWGRKSLEDPEKRGCWIEHDSRWDSKRSITRFCWQEIIENLKGRDKRGATCTVWSRHRASEINRLCSHSEDPRVDVKRHEVQTLEVEIRRNQYPEKLPDVDKGPPLDWKGEIARKWARFFTFWLMFLVGYGLGWFGWYVTLHFVRMTYRDGTAWWYFFSWITALGLGFLFAGRKLTNLWEKREEENPRTGEGHMDLELVITYKPRQTVPGFLLHYQEHTIEPEREPGASEEEKYYVAPGLDVKEVTVPFTELNYWQYRHGRDLTLTGPPECLDQDGEVIWVDITLDSMCEARRCPTGISHLVRELDLAKYQVWLLERKQERRVEEFSDFTVRKIKAVDAIYDYCYVNADAFFPRIRSFYGKAIGTDFDWEFFLKFFPDLLELIRPHLAELPKMVASRREALPPGSPEAVEAIEAAKEGKKKKKKKKEKKKKRLEPDAPLLTARMEELEGVVSDPLERGA